MPPVHPRATKAPAPSPSPAGSTSAKSNEWMTVKEVASEIRLHEQTVWRLIRAKKIRGVVKIGRSVRVYRPAVVLWRKRQLVAAGDGS